MGDYFSRWAEKYMPDPFLFAILLTFLTFILGLIFTDNGPFNMLKHWNKGFWSLLTFSMQMCLILVTGYALATTKVIRRAIDALADIPKTGAGAATLVALVAIIAAYINWGLGIIVGALMARQVALRGYEKKVPMHYPLRVRSWQDRLRCAAMRKRFPCIIPCWEPLDMPVWQSGTAAFRLRHHCWLPPMGTFWRTKSALYPSAQLSLAR
jgi:hypothetical protein